MSHIRNIYLVDDDMDDQILFKDALRSIDSRLVCHTASDGKTALDYLNSINSLPDLVFLDLNMPVMDGFAFLRYTYTSTRLKSLPVGVLSTSSMLTDMKTTKALGARFFLTKPNDFKTLCNQLQKILSYDYSKGEYLIVI